METINCVLGVGALIVVGLLCSFLVILGLNKKKVWKVLGEILYGRK